MSQFQGIRFNKPVVIPTKPKEEKEVDTSLFPIKLNVVGVTMGPTICRSCDKVYDNPQAICSECSSSDFISYRQSLLKRARAENVGICTLKKEPENPYDNKAVAVYLRFPEGELQIGYLPAKVPTDKSLSKITASQIFDIIGTKPLFTLGNVMESLESSLLGFRLNISDRP